MTKLPLVLVEAINHELRFADDTPCFDKHLDVMKICLSRVQKKFSQGQTAYVHDPCRIHQNSTHSRYDCRNYQSLVEQYPQTVGNIEESRTSYKQDHTSYSSARHNGNSNGNSNYRHVE